MTTRNLIEEAKEFAVSAHKNQMYGKYLPYIVHLHEVYTILFDFYIIDTNILVSGLLHDILEDTHYSYIQI